MQREDVNEKKNRTKHQQHTSSEKLWFRNTWYKIYNTLEQDIYTKIIGIA